MLLAGCVVFGGAIVAALVVPRGASPMAIVVGVVSLLASVTSFGTIAARYDTPQAIGAAMVVFIAGIIVGYAIASTSLPYIQRPAPEVTLRRGEGDLDGVVLVGFADPERYDPRVVARRQNLLEAGAQIVVPVTAMPFVYFAEKARYRAIGGRAPGHVIGRQLAERLTDVPEAEEWKVELAWCHTPESLPQAVATLAEVGTSRIAVVSLGMPESGQFDEAEKLLAPLLHAEDAPEVRFSASVWNDRLLPERMAERIVAATAGIDVASVGVVLVGEGAPPAWERRYSAAAEAETYFDQRVRSLLGDVGIEERNVRMSWIEWQTPDVTEAVRHVAALGCTRIVVAPTTIALPSLETALDLGHAIALARVPEEVLVITLQPWGDDDGFVDAVRRCASETLRQMRAAPESVRAEA